MIHLLFGDDTYRVHDALAKLRAKLKVSDDMVESNTAVLDGRSLAPDELLAHATAAPFLGSNRLVIVEGLLAALGEARRGRRSKKNDPDDPLAPWKAVAEALGDKARTPETTTLVFVEGPLMATNAAFPLFAPIARVVECAALKKDELAPWIDAEAKRRGVKLAPRAVASLTQAVGPDLWTLTNELEKLAAYANGEVVEPETVDEMVASVQEARMWDLTDAIVAGNEAKALAALTRLLADGKPATVLAYMIVREYRQLALVKDLNERRVRRDEAAKAAGVPSFRMGVVSGLASRFSWEQIRAAYARLLDADLNVKRGLQDDESSLQLLVHDLCAMARAGGRPRPSFARR